MYDRELVERIAQDMKLRPHLLEAMDEKKVGWLREFMESFTSINVVSNGAPD